MTQFNKGDTVRLKSGSPLMTVVDTGDYGPLGPKDGVKCMWFDGSHRMDDVFDSAALKVSDNRAQGRVVRG